MNKEFGITWRFCEECQMIQRCRDGVWEGCIHDWRPNSAAMVLQNQERELAVVQWMQEPMARVRCYQSPLEVEAMLGVIRNIDIKTIVEIGAFHGGNAELFSIAWPDAAIFTVDISYDCWMAENIATQIVGDTRNPETLAVLKGALEGRDVDFLFIDGDHSKEGALNDWNNFAPLVRTGGVVAFHDTHAIPAVKQVFDELPARMKLNIVSHQGIGVIFK